MKRLIGVMAALLVLTVVAAPFVQAADGGEGGRGVQPARPRGVLSGERPREQALDIGKAEGEGEHPPRPYAIARLLIAAVTAPWAKDDAQLQALVDKTLRDRKKLYDAEGEQMKAFGVVLKGFRDGKTRQELAAEIEALKAAHETLREAGRALREDLRAVHERMRELRPERPGNAIPEGLGNRPGRGRGDRAADDLPPEIF